MGQTVNLLVYTFGGSNPSLPTLNAVGVLKGKFKRCIFAEVAQLIEH